MLSVVRLVSLDQLEADPERVGGVEPQRSTFRARDADPRSLEPGDRGVELDCERDRVQRAAPVRDRVVPRARLVERRDEPQREVADVEVGDRLGTVAS